MSRRTFISPRDDRRWVFNRLAADYRARPAYPRGLVKRLIDLAGGPGKRVADLGAGIGHLARPLAAAGLHVSAVEPARGMLGMLLRADIPGLVPVHAAAEATGLDVASCDLVVIADALQWIDPEDGAAEVRRILAPGGALAVVIARFTDTPFLRAIGDRIAAANPRARPAPPPVELFFSLAGLPPPTVESFTDRTVLDGPSLEAVLRSLSYVGPALGPRDLAALLAEAHALAERHGGAAWERELLVHWSSGAAGAQG